jgi:hypothetical protein
VDTSLDSIGDLRVRRFLAIGRIQHRFKVRVCDLVQETETHAEQFQHWVEQEDVCRGPPQGLLVRHTAIQQKSMETRTPQHDGHHVVHPQHVFSVREPKGVNENDVAEHEVRQDE